MNKKLLVSVFFLILIFVMGLTIPTLVLPSPGIVVVPLEHNFEEVELGSSSSTIITVTNAWFDTLTIDEVILQAGSNPDFYITSPPLDGAEIGPGMSVFVEVTYTPSALGYASAVLAISWTNGDTGVSDVNLEGVGVEDSTVNTELYLGDVTLSGIQASHFPQVWNINQCDLVITATVDLNGMVDDFGGNAHAWSELGVRAVGYGDFNPTFGVEGAGVWLATDYDWAVNTFDPDPIGSPTLDLDDKLILQKAGGQGEGDYNLPSAPPNPWANHRIWFDRDGVDQWQAQNPLAVDGGTYNTGGTYDVEITLHATSSTSGTAYMTINGLNQGFETDGNWNTMELSPAGMTFTGDMTQMQVFYGLWGYGATHSVTFKDITVKGCLVIEEGMATGGGWFIPDDNDKAVGISPGGKATFGFVAKRKKETSSGQLEFQYHADDLNLKSTSYDWVTLATTQVMFEGIGMLNDEYGYKFRVRAVDGDKIGTSTDRFEIRIWTGSDTWEMPTYRAEGDLSGGQIVVHKK